MFGLCRYCGDELPHARRPLEVCAKCEDSPLCDRCGHPRSEHSQVFVRGVPSGCSKIVGDFQTGAKWPCKCGGFRPITGELSEAGFATSEDQTETVLPPLRLAADPSP